MPIPVGDLLEPLEPVTLPRGGRTLPAVDFDLGMNRLLAQVEAGDIEAERTLMRRCLPGITDDEIDALKPGEKTWIITYCGRRLEQVTEYLRKNVGGAEGAATATRPSAPTTSTSTPSPASPAPTARTGSRSRAGRSTRRSSPSIA